MNELETLQISSWSRQSLGGDDYVGKRGHKLHGASRQSEDGTKRAERLCRCRPLGDRSYTKRVITYRAPELGRRAGIGPGGEHLQGCRTSRPVSENPKTEKRNDLARRTRSASILRPPYGNLIWRRRSECTLASRTLTSFLRQCSW